LISPRPCVMLWDAGQSGRLLGLGDTLTVPPEGSVEMVGYFALASSSEKARRYCVLGDPREAL
ncbi:MAG: hypothetical protein H5T70_10685, partial [Chloroflexi bacterium]|nr:hypothetical protein [Chloroflexota bacterium]